MSPNESKKTKRTDETLTLQPRNQLLTSLQIQEDLLNASQSLQSQETEEKDLISTVDFEETLDPDQAQFFESTLNIEQIIQIDQTLGFITHQEFDQEEHQVTDGFEAMPTRYEHRYKILRLLGSGGMANVWLVRDRHLGRDVALKMLKTHLSLDRNNLTMQAFEIEARVMSQLDHPGILPVFDLLNQQEMSLEVASIAQSQSSQICGYTMRVAVYQNLGDYIDHTHPTPHEICEIIKSVALTTEHAHKRGIIHRDIKPHNILLGEEGEIYLTDWGVCMLTSEHSDAHLMSDMLRKLIVGSPQFMAPEQTYAQIVDQRADVYGLGATLYYGLTGEPPVKSGTLKDIFQAVRSHQIISPEHYPKKPKHQHKIPNELSKICMQALSLNPQDRFQSARELAEALERFISGELELEQRVQRYQEAFNIGVEEQVRFQYFFDRQQLTLSYVQQLKRRAIKAPQNTQIKAELWTLEEELESFTNPLEESFSKSVAAYREALSQDTRPEPTLALSKLFWMRYEEAEKRGDIDWAIYFESQLRGVADDESLQRLNATSQVNITGVPEGALIEVLQLQLKKYRVTETKIEELFAPLEAPLQLSRGIFLIKVTHEAIEEVNLPFILQRSEILNFTLTPPLRGVIPNQFKYIRDQWCIQNHPVTVKEYFDFLNDLPRDQATNHAPRYYHTAYALPDQTGNYVVPFHDVEGDQWLPDWPIMLVSQEDAIAYCNWLSIRLGLKVRLPSFEEWLEAAQGPDKRPYPWGRDFDPSLCSVRESQVGRPIPTSVGSVKSDCSVYGIYDVAGTIAQWTSSLTSGSEQSYRIAGAAFNSMSLLSDLTQKLQALKTDCLIHIGFRVLIELEDQHLYSSDSSSS